MVQISAESKVTKSKFCSNGFLPEIINNLIVINCSGDVISSFFCTTSNKPFSLILRLACKHQKMIFRFSPV